jgi:hypothetical protein
MLIWWRVVVGIPEAQKQLPTELRGRLETPTGCVDHFARAVESFDLKVPAADQEGEPLHIGMRA